MILFTSVCENRACSGSKIINVGHTNSRPVAYAGQLKSERAESKVKRSFAFHESLRSFRNFSSHVSNSTHYLSTEGNIISKK